MSERRKTLVAAAVLAAAVGVYVEMSYQDKLREEARRRQYFPVPSASASISHQESAKPSR
jgi:hypothetical protein